ncbi:hypothetical protein Tco_1089996 [Tanacetum coccineum]|uniref:Reverse transcriptase domain-containing protein n=1 Tax=Tanacetum coccineum TaxID=301880 RepID=A0ABQ5I514_9ASTR
MENGGRNHQSVEGAKEEKPKLYDKSVYNLVPRVNQLRSLQSFRAFPEMQELSWAAAIVARNKTKEDHEVHLGLVWNCLRKENLYAHVSNVNLGCKRVALSWPCGEPAEPVEILNREVKSLKRSKIALVKVCWNSKRGLEFTWEREDYMKSKYPQLFIDRAEHRLVRYRTRFPLRDGKMCDTMTEQSDLLVMIISMKD